MNSLGEILYCYQSIPFPRIAEAPGALPEYGREAETGGIWVAPPR